MPTGRKPTCRNIKGQLVCGALAKGGKVVKTGLHLLHKGETKLTPAKVKQMMKAGKTAVSAAKTVKKKYNAKRGRKKRCNCKH